jgi:outer membrane protein TolC
VAPATSTRFVGLCLAILAPWLAATAPAQVRAASLPEASAQGGSKVTLRQAVDSAWLRSVEAIEASGQVEVARAESQVFQNWFAAPLSLAITQREPFTAVAGGDRETSLGWVVPLWRSTYRQAGEVASAAQVELRQLAESVLRLHLAGQVRSLASSARIADIELNESRRQTANLAQIAADVRRRVDAGDLAAADRMAAEAEWLASQIQLDSVEAVWKARRSAWRLLTGLPGLPESDPAEVSIDPSHDEGLLAKHPEKLLSLARVEWARRSVDLAQLKPAAPPELGLGLRQDQPRNGGESRHSVAVSIRIPIGGEPFLKPGVTGAIAARGTAEAQVARTADRLASELTLARNRLASEASQLRSAQQRAELLAERARLVEKSFRAGESSLIELLRALALQGESALALARRQEFFNFARLQINQAVGVMP